MKLDHYKDPVRYNLLTPMTSPDHVKVPSREWDDKRAIPRMAGARRLKHLLIGRIPSSPCNSQDHRKAHRRHYSCNSRTPFHRSPLRCTITLMAAAKLYVATHLLLLHIQRHSRRSVRSIYACARSEGRRATEDDRARDL
jgi:hypothetical protein